MAIVGGVEIAVGAAILVAAPRAGAYVASAWLLLVALNLVAAGHFDVAVRDVVMSIAAFTLARAIEVRARRVNAITGPRIPAGVGMTKPWSLQNEKRAPILI